MKARRVVMIGLVAAGLASCASRDPSPVIDLTARDRPAAPSAKPAPTPAPVPTENTYTVKRGDTLYGIALEHGVDYRELAQWNYLDDPARLRVGQVLKLKPEDAQPSKLGGVIVGRVETRPLESRPLDERQVSPPREVPKEAPAASSGATDFMWPAKGKILAGFEQTKGKGVDIDGKVGDPIVASAKGKVTYVGSGIRGLGRMLIIQHNEEFLTVYAHTNQILVKEQQVVERGQKIAEIGSTDSEKPMLHFQIRKLGRPLDPTQFLPAL